MEFDITSHLGLLAPGENVLAIHGLNWQSSSSDMLISPQLVAESTQSGSETITTDQDRITLGGRAWINAKTIHLQGQSQPLEVTWTTVDTWQATVPVAFGTQALVFEARDFDGNVIATDEVTVTSTYSDRPLEEFLRITELMYHPGDPTVAEAEAGSFEADEFEFIELHNTHPTETLDLTGVTIGGGINFEFIEGASTALAPGGYVVIVENAAAFAQRYGGGIAMAGEYSGRLSNGGEPIQLDDLDGGTILEFTYDDIWYPSTDGPGNSLVIIDP